MLSGAMPSVKRLVVAGLIVLALLAVPWFAKASGNPALITLATRIVIYAIAAISLDLILGYGGLASFGHAAYFGLGGYVVGIMAFHARSGEPLLGFIPGTDQILVTVPAAILLCGAVAMVLGALSLRTSGIHFIMITLAFAQMLFYLFVSIPGYGADDGLSFRRRNELPFLNTRDDTTYYYLCLALMLGFLFLCSRFVRSRFGMVLEGLRQSERRMAAIGISAFPYRLAAFVIAGMGAGLAGALWTNLARFVSPDMLHWTKSGELMIMVILGGAGTLVGPVLGAAALLGLETVISQHTENWQFWLGPILILTILFARRGLYGLFQRRSAGGAGHD